MLYTLENAIKACGSGQCVVVHWADLFDYFRHKGADIGEAMESIEDLQRRKMLTIPDRQGRMKVLPKYIKWHKEHSHGATKRGVREG